MIESFNSISSERIFFPPGKQGGFLLTAKRELDVTWKKLAEIANTSPRNLTDWRREKYSISLKAVKNICAIKGWDIPRYASIKPAYWYTRKGGLAGGKVTSTKYRSVGGDPQLRKEKWKEWWETKGKLKSPLPMQPLPFRKPKYSVDLAEFVGIILGDGGISDYQVTITLHRTDDADYLLFVVSLIRKLFNIRPHISQRKTFLADSIVISRIGLVNYLINDLGLKKGSKVRQQVDIPTWIKDNREYGSACLRGLIDTDGCLITHKYRSSGKTYSYKKIGFTNRSFPILQSASEILANLGIKHRIMKNGFDIRIEAQSEVEKYFKLVGSNNAKHVRKYTEK